MSPASGRGSGGTAGTPGAAGRGAPVVLVLAGGLHAISYLLQEARAAWLRSAAEALQQRARERTEALRGVAQQLRAVVVERWRVGALHLALRPGVAPGRVLRLQQQVGAGGTPTAVEAALLQQLEARLCLKLAFLALQLGPRAREEVQGVLGSREGPTGPLVVATWRVWREAAAHRVGLRARVEATAQSRRRMLAARALVAWQAAVQHKVQQRQRVLLGWLAAARQQAKDAMQREQAAAFHRSRLLLAALAHWRGLHVSSALARTWEGALVRRREVLLLGRALRLWHFYARRCRQLIRQLAGHVAVGVPGAPPVESHLPAPLRLESVRRRVDALLAAARDGMLSYMDELLHLRGFLRFGGDLEGPWHVRARPHDRSAVRRSSGAGAEEAAAGGIDVGTAIVASAMATPEASDSDSDSAGRRRGTAASPGGGGGGGAARSPGRMAGRIGALLRAACAAGPPGPPDGATEAEAPPPPSPRLLISGQWRQKHQVLLLAAQLRAVQGAAQEVEQQLEAAEGACRSSRWSLKQRADELQGDAERSRATLEQARAEQQRLQGELEQLDKELSAVSGYLDTCHDVSEEARRKVQHAQQQLQAARAAHGELREAARVAAEREAGLRQEAHRAAVEAQDAAERRAAELAAAAEGALANGADPAGAQAAERQGRERLLAAQRRLSEALRVKAALLAHLQEVQLAAATAPRYQAERHALRLGEAQDKVVEAAKLVVLAEAEVNELAARVGLLTSAARAAEAALADATAQAAEAAAAADAAAAAAAAASSPGPDPAQPDEATPLGQAAAAARAAAVAEQDAAQEVEALGLQLLVLQQTHELELREPGGGAADAAAPLLDPLRQRQAALQGQLAEWGRRAAEAHTELEGVLAQLEQLAPRLEESQVLYSAQLLRLQPAQSRLRATAAQLRARLGSLPAELVRLMQGLVERHGIEASQDARGTWTVRNLPPEWERQLRPATVTAAAAASDTSSASPHASPRASATRMTKPAARGRLTAPFASSLHAGDAAAVHPTAQQRTVRRSQLADLPGAPVEAAAAAAAAASAPADHPAAAAPAAGAVAAGAAAPGAAAAAAGGRAHELRGLSAAQLARMARSALGAAAVHVAAARQDLAPGPAPGITAGQEPGPAPDLGGVAAAGIAWAADGAAGARQGAAAVSTEEQGVSLQPAGGRPGAKRHAASSPLPADAAAPSAAAPAAVAGGARGASRGGGVGAGGGAAVAAAQGATSPGLEPRRKRVARSLGFGPSDRAPANTTTTTAAGGGGVAPTAEASFGASFPQHPPAYALAPLGQRSDDDGEDGASRVVSLADLVAQHGPGQGTGAGLSGSSRRPPHPHQAAPGRTARPAGTTTIPDAALRAVTHGPAPLSPARVFMRVLGRPMAYEGTGSSSSSNTSGGSGGGGEASSPGDAKRAGGAGDLEARSPAAAQAGALARAARAESDSDAASWASDAAPPQAAAAPEGLPAGALGTRHLAGRAGEGQEDPAGAGAAAAPAHMRAGGLQPLHDQHAEQQQQPAVRRSGDVPEAPVSRSASERWQAWQLQQQQQEQQQQQQSQLVGPGQPPLPPSGRAAHPAPAAQHLASPSPSSPLPAPGQALHRSLSPSIRTDAGSRNALVLMRLIHSSPALAPAEAPTESDAAPGAAAPRSQQADGAETEPKPEPERRHAQREPLNCSAPTAGGGGRGGGGGRDAARAGGGAVHGGGSSSSSSSIGATSGDARGGGGSGGHAGRRGGGGRGALAGLQRSGGRYVVDGLDAAACLFHLRRLCRRTVQALLQHRAALHTFASVLARAADASRARGALAQLRGVVLGPRRRADALRAAHTLLRGWAAWRSHVRARQHRALALMTAQRWRADRGLRACFGALLQHARHKCARRAAVAHARRAWLCKLLHGWRRGLLRQQASRETKAQMDLWHARTVARRFLRRLAATVRARGLLCRVLARAERLWDEQADALEAYGSQYCCLRRAFDTLLSYTAHRRAKRAQRVNQHAADAFRTSLLLVRAFGAWQAAVQLCWRERHLARTAVRLLRCWRRLAHAAREDPRSRCSLRRRLRARGFGGAEACVRHRVLLRTAVRALAWRLEVPQRHYERSLLGRALGALRTVPGQLDDAARTLQQHSLCRRRRALLQQWKAAAQRVARSRRAEACVAARRRRYLQHVALQSWRAFHQQRRQQQRQAAIAQLHLQRATTARVLCALRGHLAAQQETADGYRAERLLRACFVPWYRAAAEARLRTLRLLQTMAEVDQAARPHGLPPAAAARAPAGGSLAQRCEGGAAPAGGDGGPGAHPAVQLQAGSPARPPLRPPLPPPGPAGAHSPAPLYLHGGAPGQPAQVYVLQYGTPTSQQERTWRAPPYAASDAPLDALQLPNPNVMDEPTLALWREHARSMLAAEWNRRSTLVKGMRGFRVALGKATKVPSKAGGRKERAPLAPAPQKVQPVVQRMVKHKSKVTC